MERISSGMSLGEFLRSRRERLTPEEVGLVSYGRRRTPGLRREEVAQLAHIGTSWYSYLEQDKDVHPSDDVLRSLAEALRLTEVERRHLYLLARPERQEKAEEPALNAGLEWTIKALEPNPAFALGRCWDLLQWNKAAELVFQLPSFSNDGQQKPNWMRHLLIDAKPEWIGENWEAKAQILIARFRADYARFPKDTRFKELVDELMQSSRLFRETWPLHYVEAPADCRKQGYDPRIGEMEFEHVTLQPPTHPDQKIMIYTASTDTAARLRSVLSGS
ncbi:helix-turn-helix transcriptional regulator [Cohnella zeiphila]|uniref:Helix-turn-helix domain-containing protein n=1 Tax=Cohnella zeiphila TaxID=2761120 RepID=A0A7X0SKA6_9BACL|nr:helix-turn-helix transcriptional regulator [Cohnella zeiphila]MBB6731532.1 helix-turn-helix domain-containing protein [Cohnella zeiphila]